MKSHHRWSQGLVTLLTSVTFILSSYTVVLTTSQFTVQPVSVVQAQGLNAVFECQHPGAQYRSWGFDGEFPADSSYPPNVTFTLPSGTLTIPATAQYNNSVVQCKAEVRNGQMLISELSVNATLQVQGPLPAVADLTVNNVAGNCSQLNVTWVAPFSLNLTTAEPDIQYCVDVYNITYERKDNLLQSECIISDTQYLFEVDYLMGTYYFLVTPRSNIDSSLNGTTSTAQFSYEPQAIPIDEVNFTTNTELSPLRVTFPRSCQVQSGYSIKIQYIDQKVADPCICSTNQSTGNTQMIALDLNCSCNITRHRRCNLTLLAESNLPNRPSVMTMNISTHDVYKLYATMEENEVSITVEYLPDSSDTGFFAIVYSPSDILYRVVNRKNLASLSNASVGSLANYIYKLAVFDLNDIMEPANDLVFPAVLSNKILNNTQHGTKEPSAGGEDVTSMNATEFNGMICISCNSSCVGIIHSQDGLTQDNITLIPLTVTGYGQRCTKNMSHGNYFAAIFNLSSEVLDNLPLYTAMIPIGSSTFTTTASNTTTPPVVNNSATSIGGIVAATVLLFVVFLVVVSVIVLIKKPKKHRVQRSTGLLDNEYNSVPPLNGPPPILTYQYENVELISLTRATVSIDEPPPSYATCTCTSKQDMDESSVLSSTLSSPDHVPISADWTGHNVSTLERCNHDTAPNHSANNRVTQAMGASENEHVASVYLHTELNTSCLENPTQLPHDQSVESTPKDPVYDVAKQGLANSSPTQNNNKTEIPVVYADLDVKPKANSTPSMQHPVVYALIDGSSLAPRSVENNTPCILPSLSPPLTAESVLAEIYPVAKRWEALGEALGIKEHHLDSFSTEGHEQVCLHDMILYYFNFGPHSWEDIVKALWEIRETEAADKIIRSGKCTVELPVTSPTETPPPLPPRNDTANAASHQTEAGDDWQDNSAQESDTLNTKEQQVTQDSVQSADQGELDEYNSGVHFPRSTGVGNKSEDGPTGRKNNSLASTLNNTINELPCFPIVCKSAVHDPILDKEEPTVPYCTTMIHSLGVFEKLDVPRNHKVRALGYLNSGQSALLKNLYQQRMSAADEVHENNVSHVAQQNDNTAIENNGYTVKQSVGDSSSIPLLKRGEPSQQSIDIDPSITSYLCAEVILFTRHPANCSTDDVGFAVHVGCYTGLEVPNLPRSGSDMSLDSRAPLEDSSISSLMVCPFGRIDFTHIVDPLPDCLANRHSDALSFPEFDLKASKDKKKAKKARKQLNYELVEQTRCIKEKFMTLRMAVYKYAISIPRAAKIIEIAISSNEHVDIDELYTKFTEGADFLNYDILLHRLDILKKSDTGEENELRRSAEAAAEIYKAPFKEYAQQRVILVQDAHSGHSHSVYKELKIKVEEEFHSFETNRLLYFKKVVKTILTYISLRTTSVSVEICFEMIGLLADKAFHLTTDQKQELLANNIDYDGQVPYCCCEVLSDESSRDTIKKLYDDVCQTDYQNNELTGETVTSTPNTNDIQSTRVRDFPFHPTTWAYFRGVRFKGVQLLEHGCIFQPENLSCILFYPTTWAFLRGVRFEGVQLLEHGCIFQPKQGDICHLEVVSCPGELELDRQMQRLQFEYLITSDDECLLSQWLHNTVRWLTNNTFSRCPLIQWMVARLDCFTLISFGRVFGMLQVISEL